MPWLGDDYRNEVYQSLFQSQTTLVGLSPWGEFRFDPVRDDEDVKRGYISDTLKASIAQDQRLCIIDEIDMDVYKFVDHSQVLSEMALLRQGVGLKVDLSIPAR
ncbi:hypothetical protein [Vibrio sp. WXL103]|uniref:hypothetical protein n=1 Tax=Vibrio sp. WXL103 TaxID=3450710 RepID=UPI003EC4F0FF